MIASFFKHLTLSDWGVFITAFVAVLTAVEKMFKVKFIGTLITNEIITFLRAGKDVKLLTSKIDYIKKELTFNGGSTLKNTVVEMKAENKVRIAMLAEILLRMNVADEWDNRMIFKLDEKAECVFINRAFLNHFGWLEKDIVGKNWENVIEPEELQLVTLKWERAIDTKSNYKNEQHILTYDNNSHFCLVQASPILIDGELKGFYGIIEMI